MKRGKLQWRGKLTEAKVPKTNKATVLPLVASPLPSQNESNSTVQLEIRE